MGKQRQLKRRKDRRIVVCQGCMIRFLERSGTERYVCPLCGHRNVNPDILKPLYVGKTDHYLIFDIKRTIG